MTDSTPHQFADDSPRENPWRDDDLGFLEFSRRAARALVRQHAPSGYVLGLHGEWGSGKSTVLNFVRSFLKKWQDEEEPDTQSLLWFDFEPWIVSGHQDLAAAFFKILSEKLGGLADKKARLRRGASAAIETGAGPLIDAVSKIGIVLDHTGGTASAAGAAMTKAAIRKASDKWLTEPSLQKAYAKLVERLKASDRRFIIFVDDIDRLTAEEIRSLMQMVKTVGRLPNVTYCLAYDREIVWAALAGLAPGDGVRSGYAEKIVQHELEVPVPSRSGLMQMLQTSLPALPPAPTRGMRWHEILNAGLYRWIRHPRDVVRLANGMHFAWAALENEVDAWDMLCMEALRLFDRRVFDWIRDNRSLLMAEEVRAPHSDDPAAAAAELGQYLSEGARANIIPILKLLFPNSADLFGPARGLTNEPWAEVAARRGVATKAGFTAYFSLAPSPNAVPKRMIDKAASGLSFEKQCVLIETAIALEDESGNSLIGEYFRELDYRADGLLASHLVALLEALVETAEVVFALDDPLGSFGPASSHHVLIGRVLDRLGPEAAADALDRIFDQSTHVGALAALFVDIGSALGEIATGRPDRRAYIPADRLAALGARLLGRLEKNERTGMLGEAYSFYDIAQAWRYLGGNAAPRAWLAREAVRDGHSLVKVAQGLVGRSGDRSGVRFGLHRSVDIEFFDIDALSQGCALFLDAPGLTDIERGTIRALNDGMERLRRIEASIQTPAVDE